MSYLEKDKHLKLALRLMVTYLEEMKVIKKEMSREEKIDIMELFIVRYPKKLTVLLDAVNILSIPEEVS